MDKYYTGQWSGVLNEDNIEGVVARIRSILCGEKFSIGSCEYADSGNAEVRLITDAILNPAWTYEPKNELVRLSKFDDGRRWFGLSAGGYAWQWNAAPSGITGNPEKRWPYFVLEQDNFKVEQCAPAGRGYLHKHIFKIQQKGNT